jgi:tetratricopeptide (TPR) repeat protein
VNSRPAGNRVMLPVAIGLGLAALAAGGYFAARSRHRLPSPDSAVYEQMTRSFYLGLASLQVGLLDDAKGHFTRATELVPEEPAAWANLGLAHLRLGEFDAASQPLERAVALAPRNGDVVFLQAQLETSRGRLDEGIARFRRAVDLDPRNPRAIYALAHEIESASGPNADAEAQRLLDRLLELRPDNLAVLLERTRVAAKRGDGRLLQDSVGRLRKQVGGGVAAASAGGAWPAAAVEQYGVLQRAAEGSNFQDAARAVAVLRNLLVRLPAFRDDLLAIRTPSELVADPFDRFLRLPSPSSKPSPSDDALTFSRERIGAGRPEGWNALAAFSPNGTDPPAIFTVDAREVGRAGTPGVSMPFPGGAVGAPPSANAVLPIDWNRDFRMDLVLAGSGGVKLLVQEGDGTFHDATAAAAGKSETLTADCFGAWTADIEMDGDLDIIAGVNGAAPVVLRNNGDGTWRRLELFPGVVGLRAFVWGDLDGDGDPDAALLDAQGNLHLFENRQAGRFEPMKGPDGLGHLVALALGDVNGDGVLDLVTLDANGTIRRASRGRDGWEQQQLAVWSDRPEGAVPGAFRLFLEDLDNNGSLDLVASGAGRSKVWLSGERGDFRLLRTVPDAEIFGVVDLDNDGQLDLVGLSNGQPVRFMGHGTKGYHWQVFRPRAQATAGDQRINSFGIGGEMEIRSGLLTEKQPVTGTSVHFGLGTRTGIDVARIVWPNGVLQADFDRGADQVMVAEQRLKGSCPWVFTYDGTGMRFVTDFLWRSPLGLRINAQDTAGVSQTEDWVKIRADQLVPRNGSYDVRISAELWETHFIDHVSLMAVDHPRNFEVFVDERFVKQAPALEVHAMTPPRPVARAWDEMGRDVTALVARQDGRYLASFERGDYQGIARDHFVDVDLGREIPRGTRMWLVANGFIYPTDSSINVAIGQGRQVQPRGLSLEALDEAGRWVVVSPDLGFPAGKNKTILIDLSAVVRAGLVHTRRLRLRTNLEIYWDSLAIADDVPDAEMEMRRIGPDRAELRYRGFSKTSFARRDVPEVPRYNEIANVAPRWRDLVGYYTRFGDVRELLDKVDDRYVIMNAGDELQMSFPAPPEPSAGWTRDFVLIGDGWVKDGDYNTSSSKTVLPLPSHDQHDYKASSTDLELEQDPVYCRQPDDWQRYHTRFVTPRGFLRGLR